MVARTALAVLAGRLPDASPLNNVGADGLTGTTIPAGPQVLLSAHGLHQCPPPSGLACSLRGVVLPYGWHWGMPAAAFKCQRSRRTVGKIVIAGFGPE